MDARDKIIAATEALGLTVRAEFVPWSASRNRSEREPSLNWKITLVRDGRDVLTTDYGAGSGHCPSYKSGGDSAVQRKLIAFECERGFAAVWGDNVSRPVFAGISRKPILPDTCSVIASLIVDADALDHAGFEGWASTHGEDPDGRAAERTYRACLEIALKLRSAVGDDGMRKLSEACRDF